MPTPEQIHATLDAYLAAYRNNDREALLALFAPDAEWTDPVGSETHHGRDGVGAFWDMARSMAESIVLEPVHVHICGDEAAVVVEIHSMVGGTEMIIDAVEVWTFDDQARIQVGRVYWELEKARFAPA